MGIRFRKSIKMGPIRINLSKSGVGYSVGTKGYRVTKRADGKVQRTASIPGTGISHVKVYSSGVPSDSTVNKQPQKSQEKKFLDTGFGKFVAFILIVLGVIVGIFLLFQLFRLILFLAAL